MKDYLNQKVLLTTSAWFYAPDGKIYNAVWGTLKSVQEAKTVFGFSPGRTHANWFLEIGDMLITGCQVNYCMKCPNKPPDMVEDWAERDHELQKAAVMYTRPTKIYFTT